jgi:DNA repair exonuclease SbcCD ATPase subunit|nr:MAG TPA: STRUCTURAL MAINTENANCE OF CHROMOSOMES PROTEIN [Caudoviricetes sp.]
MLLKRLKLVNYGGIYNGMGLYEIEIDFTRCRNKIVLIKGDNGSGKSTIESALKPLPDDNSSFISGVSACKEIEYIDETNSIVYSISYIHEYKNQSRISKGYFKKILPNGNVIDLNPSGNISSCKEMINEELELDANYITLTQLSSTKRGIADLRPAERKRYVNSILSSTDVYNTMYKTLSKKASTYKALMSSISSKIDNVGNTVQLQEELKSIESKISETEKLMEQHNEVINKEKGMLLSIDPNNEISNRIETYTESTKTYSSKRDEFSKQLNKIYSTDPNLSTIVINKEILDKLNQDIIDTKYLIESTKERINNLIKEREQEASRLEEETAKLKSINSGMNLIEVQRIKDDLTSRKEKIRKRWGDIVDLNTITHDEFMIAYEAIKQMIEILNQPIELIPSDDIEIEYLDVLRNIERLDNEIEDTAVFRNKIEMNEYKLDILEQRPSDCNNNSCPFIADALKAKKIIDELMKQRKGFTTISELNKQKESYEQKLSNVERNKRLLEIYNTNRIILSKLQLNLDTYENCVVSLSRNRLMILPTLAGFIEYSNDLIEYKSIDKDLNDITVKYNALYTQKDLINMITDSIDRLNVNINEDTVKINAMNEEITSLTKKYNDMCKLCISLEDIFNLRASLNECEESLRILNEEIEKDRSNIDRIEKLNSDIEKLNVNISELKSQLEPLRKAAESLRYRITLSVEYSKEYEQYNMMYTKIETLKYYCSPTTGIQLLFANMYLNKIMDNANKILSRLFGGTFALLPLIITESEFRIPVAVRGGINHDDITSMSSAQISLISMIISISLLSQTSTKLNIIVGDEIDAPFDSENRREFMNILTQLMGLVNSSQCVLISHNSEISLNDCDVILLKNENDVITEGNIIWSYK